jgi:hypothetical protein
LDFARAPLRETPKGDAFSHVAEADAEGRPFLCAPYVVVGGNVRPVEGISRCPWAGGGEECKLSPHSFRARKTGPQFPLRVLRCHLHDQHFTVYSVAFVPYARRGLAPVDVAGHPLQAPESASAREGRGEKWRGTMFRGAAGGCGREALAA